MGNTPQERELRRESATTFLRAEKASQAGDFPSSRVLYAQSEDAERALRDIENTQLAVPWTTADHAEERSWGPPGHWEDAGDESDAAC